MVHKPSCQVWQWASIVIQGNGMLFLRHVLSSWLALLFRAVLWQPGICGKGGDGGFVFMLLPQKRKNYKEQKQQSWKCKTAWQLNVMLDMICCCLVLYTSILHCVFLFTFCLVPSGRTVWLLQKANLMWLHFFFFQSDEEGGKEKEGEDGQQKFIAHVPVPSQQEVRHQKTGLQRCAPSVILFCSCLVLFQMLWNWREIRHHCYIHLHQRIAKSVINIA